MTPQRMKEIEQLILDWSDRQNQNEEVPLRKTVVLGELNESFGAANPIADYPEEYPTCFRFCEETATPLADLEQWYSQTLEEAAEDNFIESDLSEEELRDHLHG